jgi:hypothetical protein
VNLLFRIWSRLAAPLLLFAALGCGHGGSGGPVISSFAPAQSSVSAGSGTTLTAVFSSGTGSIDQGIGAVTSGVPVATGALSAGRTYTLTVSNSLGGHVSASTTVSILGGPAVPVITLSATSAVAGATGLTASVPAQAGCGYAWTITGGTLVSGAGTDRIGFTAGAMGTLNLTCVATDGQGVASAPGTASVAVAAAPVLATPQQPVISTSVGQTVVGTQNLTAWVSAQSGCSFTWTIQGGTITAGNGTAQITFTATSIGALSLDCTASALGASSEPGAAGVTVTAVVPPDAPGITAPAYITQSQDGNLASVNSPVAGYSYSWTISNGVFDGASQTPTGTSVSYYSNVSGVTVSVGCCAINAQAVASPYSTATSLVVAQAATPSLAQPAAVIIGVVGNPVSVQSPVASTSYAWTLSGGSFAGSSQTPTGTSQAFTAAGASLVAITCTASNQADTAANPVSISIPAYPGWRFPTGTLLPGGQTLMAGGEGFDNSGDWLILANAALVDPATGIMTATGAMHQPRENHTATLLANGKVLITGGQQGTLSNETAIASAELFDPATGTFTLTSGQMTTPRVYHTATLLPSGKVLITGGLASGSQAQASAELYDPATDSFSATTNGSGQVTTMAAGRMYHTATLLPGTGKVLITGGETGGDSLASAELYDPVAGTFTPTKDNDNEVTAMTEPREWHTATLLGDGTVLIAGGYGGPDADSEVCWASAETFDPVTGLFRATTGPMANAREYQTATLLPSGNVLIAGGANVAETILAAPELYHPVAGSFGNDSTAMTSTRMGDAAILLPGGLVLLAAGEADGPVAPAALDQLYAPDDGNQLETGLMLALYPSAVLSFPQDVQATIVVPAALTSATRTLAWSSTPLPAGMSMDPSTGALGGIPTSTGTTHCTVTVTDGTLTGICDLWITVVAQ